MIKYSLDNKNLVIEFMSTELDHHITNEVRDEIDDILMSKSVKNIIFDFKNIKFMDSSGIGVIIGRYKKVSNEGGKVSVVNVNARVKKIFNLSGMNKIIGIYDTYEEVVSSL
ncbi:anti-sigma F factor antagonist [Romboutsia lituseburensis]|uniref:Anti-sigma F factor antagonist n=1 Tax=Romboutsia lituseburensis DSM 797 TaxID=1121325 RepID=A0A1G9R7E1_9FIRM|nr:anti-sigma F factor antagonist [Romboutsia lituseburensis]MCR8745525.1 anti-sigma F factor antagonist [Romboutsia lituseburensis]CEH35695.1 spore_II_AA: anti-sigma F factor antagonist [Romboutsia lituseburensis]SDM19144.1 anti-anti-sigma regulatory factor, SpoIIAA [Romboutsia lituseburensis DSM 797]